MEFLYRYIITTHSIILIKSSFLSHHLRSFTLIIECTQVEFGGSQKSILSFFFQFLMPVQHVCWNKWFIQTCIRKILFVSQRDIRYEEPCCCSSTDCIGYNAYIRSYYMQLIYYLQCIDFQWLSIDYKRVLNFSCNQFSIDNPVT